MSEYKALWQKNPYRNLWQHPLWTDFQETIGRKTWLIEEKDASALVIKHKLPKGFNWLEVPRGPLFESKKGLDEILSKIQKIGKKEKSIFIRLSPYKKLSNVKCPMLNVLNDHHPEVSLVINLSQSESDILSQMKPKGRYNIKVAERHGVTVESSKDVSPFFDLLKKTGNRDGFGIHTESYYQKFLETFGDNAQLLLAKFEGQVIAGGLFVYLDDWGIYYYGASDNQHRNVMAPYLIQWTAIKESKQRGCTNYDFLGIAPDDSKNHPWTGVTDFKKKFGGQVVSYPSAQEIVLRPFWHFLYRFLKR